MSERKLSALALEKYPSVSLEQWRGKWTDAQMEAAGWLEPVSPAVTQPPPAQDAVPSPSVPVTNADGNKEWVRKLAEAEDELYTAQNAFNQHKDDATTHQCRNWVKRAERDVAHYRQRLGDLAPPERAAAQPTAIGAYVTSSLQPAMFDGFVYVNDIHRIVSPSGFLMDKSKFDAHPKFAGRLYQMKADGAQPSASAWDSFVLGQEVQGVKVDGLVFKPTERPGAIIEMEGSRFVNTWRPVNIPMVPGDVEPFLAHLRKLFPHDWRKLLNYLKFMMQRKGVKVMWWPFIQGVPGNGKSYISDTMEYCLGFKFTQRPTPKNIDSQFNASLYGCLFLALEDVKVTDDYGAMWDTIKPMITQARLAIQPKGVDVVTREVCFNGIMNSNSKDGIRKERDDRRIAPFFSAQQIKAHLKRDGLTTEYFRDLWTWSKPELGGEGWPRVAYYLAHECIDHDFNPAEAPITSSTEEAIRVGRTPAEREIGEAIEGRLPGFRGGWVNMNTLDAVLNAHNLRHTKRQTRVTIVEALGYMPHPGLIEGRLSVPLIDSSYPILYIEADHRAVDLTEPAAIRDAYLADQK